MTGMRGLFVTARAHLDMARPGGVQICSHEYIAGLRAAGVSLEILDYQPKPSIPKRLSNRLVPNPYRLSFDRTFCDSIRQRSRDADFVFLNQVTLASFAPHLRAGGMKAQIILLSHGCEITDYLPILRCLDNGYPLSARTGFAPSLTLGSILSEEARLRRYVDGAIGLSEPDRQLEDWLGTPRNIWIPRTIEPDLLDWRPVPDIFGYVGTLDHAPNLEGLVETLAALQASDSTATVEIVGGPEGIGTWLAQRHANARYLGPLDNDRLREKAAGWTAFLHPIFHLSRGCSTKLAQAIGWGLPVVTTPQGRRGYVWTDGDLIECSSPKSFAAAISSMGEDQAERARSATLRLLASSPRIADVGSSIARFLSHVGP